MPSLDELLDSFAASTVSAQAQAQAPEPALPPEPEVPESSVKKYHSSTSRDHIV